MIWGQPALPAFPILFVVLAACSPSRLAAQELASGPDDPVHYPTRSGIWFSAGLGIGANNGFGGVSGNFVLGGTVNQRVLLGVGSTDWRVPLDRTMLTMGTLDLRMQLYPEANAGFFLTGGLGLGYARTDDSGTGADIGSGVVLGLGYDARVAANTSITPVINWVHFHTPDPHGSFLQLGVGLTLH